MPHRTETRAHRNAPLTTEDRLRLVLRCQLRPIADIAAEAGVSRQCLSTWVQLYRREDLGGGPLPALPS
jgi:transposase-like protein